MKNIIDYYPVIYHGGRQTGKSSLITTMLKARQSVPGFILLSSRVDDVGITWYTVKISVLEVQYWMLEQDARMYSELQSDSIDQYEIHEQLLTMMALRWS